MVQAAWSDIWADIFITVLVQDHHCNCAVTLVEHSASSSQEVQKTTGDENHYIKVKRRQLKCRRGSNCSFFLQLKIQPLLWPVQGTISFTSCFHISSATFPITHSHCSGLSTTTNHQSNSGWVSICLLISYSCLCVFQQLCASEKNRDWIWVRSSLNYRVWPSWLPHCQ